MTCIPAITFRILLLLAVVFATIPSMAQQVEAFDLFAGDSVLQVRLTTDMKQLVKEKFDEEYQPATLEIMRTPGATETYQIEIRSRGNRRKEVCYYPPIKLKFPEDAYSNNTLKWVNSCRDSELYEEMLFKEYLAYKLFEILTEKSFRTHLVKVEYVDTGRGEETFTRHAFIIEDADALAERLGGRVYEPSYLKFDILNREQLALFTMFEYMISNTDWAFANRHNIEAIAHRASNSIYVIPYDFDYSGFVNTTYAVPHETLPISSVTTRYNKGICLEERECLAMAQKILAKKDAITEYCNSMTFLSENQKKRIESDLSDFWYLLADEKATIMTFAKNCDSDH